MLIKPKHGYAECCTYLDSLQLMEIQHRDLAVVNRDMCITLGTVDGKVIEKQKYVMRGWQK